MRIEVKRCHDRGPRVHIGGQQIGRTDHRVDKRGLPRLDLTDHGDRRLGVLELMVQAPRRAVRRLVADLADLDERLAQFPRTAQERLQSLEPASEEVGLFNGRCRAPLHDRRLNFHFIHSTKSTFPMSG